MPPSSDPIPAATLVVFREGRSAPEPEILMVVRSKQLRFAGGMAVFPGGRVDPEDRDLAARHAPDQTESVQDELAHRIAAIRETLEETGLALGLSGAIDAEGAAAARKLALQEGALAPVLDRFGWKLDAQALVCFARWLPLGLAHDRIFDTRFYLADLGTGAVDVAVDETENTRLFWTSAKGALAMADEGEISVIFPTRRNLERLAQFASYEEARAHALATPVRTIIPQIDESGPQPMLRIPDDAGYPVTEEAFGTAQRG